MAGELLGKRMEKSLATWEVLPERRASFWAVRVWTTGHSYWEILSARQLHDVEAEGCILGAGPRSLLGSGAAPA